MPSVNSISLRDKFNVYKTDIVSLQEEGKISKEAGKVIKRLCLLLEIIIAIFFEKTTKKTSKNSSIPPSQTGKDENGKISKKNAPWTRSRIWKRPKTSGRLLSRKPPQSKPAAVAVLIFQISNHRIMKNVFRSISNSRLKRKRSLRKSRNVPSAVSEPKGVSLRICRGRCNMVMASRRL